MSDLEKISIDDVHENELYIIWTHIISSIMLDDVEQTLIDDSISKEDIIFMKKLHKIIMGIDNCLRTIDISCLFLRRFYGKKYYEGKNVLLVDYIAYHYDVICYKAATLKDLYFKLINHLYRLGIAKKDCSWKNISSQEVRINNPTLFKILNSNYKYLKDIIEIKRNNSAHEGCLNDLRLEKMNLYEFLISSKSKQYIEDFSTIDKMNYEIKIRKAKNVLIKETNTIRYNTFILTKCVFCSLSDIFAEVISDNIKEKYKFSIEKGIDAVFKTKKCIYYNNSKCKFWMNYK